MDESDVPQWKIDEIQLAKEGFFEYIEEQKIDLIENLSRNFDLTVNEVYKVWREC